MKEGGDMDNEIIIDKGCGLDVHKETVVACGETSVWYYQPPNQDQLKFYNIK
jgi:hypothetical protein